jgi:hypothetical protein
VGILFHQVSHTVRKPKDGALSVEALSIYDACNTLDERRIRASGPTQYASISLSRGRQLPAPFLRNSLNSPPGRAVQGFSLSLEFNNFHDSMPRRAVRHCRDVKVIGWRAEPEWRTAIASIVIQYCNIVLVHMGISEFGTVSCVFIKWFGTGVFVLVLVYADDFLTLSPSGVQLEEVHQAIAAIYEIHRMKEVKLYLAVELRGSKTKVVQ